MDSNNRKTKLLLSPQLPRPSPRHLVFQFAALCVMVFIYIVLALVAAGVIYGLYHTAMVIFAD